MKFLRTTVLGGVVFLVPIVVLAILIGKALQWTGKLATPLARVLPIETIGVIAIVHILALAILILVCFVAGLAAKTAAARRLVSSLESNILERIIYSG